MLGHWLSDTEAFASPDSLHSFQKDLPFDWVVQALEKTNKASVRKRKLPAELVVWLVIGMGLFRDRPINDVLEKLELHLSTEDGETVAPSAIPQARQRLTEQPLAELFSITSKQWALEEDGDDTWLGLKLFSIDGTQFRCHDNKAVADHFGYIKHRADRHTEYPVVRLCAMSSLRSRLLYDVAFGPCGTGENSYAKSLIGTAPNQSLTIFDRCYLSAELLVNWHRQGINQHWMVPIKKNTKYTVIEKLGTRDYLVEMAVSAHARKLDPTLPETWQARLVLYPEKQQPNHIIGLLSSLSDPLKYQTEAVLAVYFERWEIERAYGEIKHQMLEDATLLRSQTVDGIKQEIWGILMAYNLVRLEISRIAKEANVTPLRISFVTALRDIQDELLWCAIASPGSIPSKLKKMRQRVKRYILPEKRKRPKSRTVRISKIQYPVRSKHA